MIHFKNKTMNIHITVVKFESIKELTEFCIYISFQFVFLVHKSLKRNLNFSIHNLFN